MTKKGTTKKVSKKAVAKTSTKSAKKTASKKTAQKTSSKLYICTSKGVVLGEVKPVKQLLFKHSIRVFYLMKK